MARRIAGKGIDAEQDRRSLPPWSHDDVVRYDAEGRERFRQEHGLDGKFVVMYSGNHSPCHPLATLLEAARTLRDRAGHRVLLRRRRQRARHRAAVCGAEHDSTNIVIMPYQPLDAAGGVAVVRRPSHRRDGRPVRRHRPSVQGLQHPRARHSVSLHRTRREPRHRADAGLCRRATATSTRSCGTSGRGGRRRVSRMRAAPPEWPCHQAQSARPDGVACSEQCRQRQSSSARSPRPDASPQLLNVQRSAMYSILFLAVTVVPLLLRR